MISRSGPTHSGTPQVQSIIIAAIILFAFSGLMVGFAVGAFARTAKPSTADNNTNPMATSRAIPTPTSPPTPTAVTFIHLAPPVLNLTPNPNGIQTYTASIHAQENPVATDTVTCRIWLVSAQTNVTDDLSKDTSQLQHTDTFGQLFPHEIQGALVFDPATTNETQACVQGSAEWRFTISSRSVSPGDYFLVGLTDWQGKSYNWSWQSLTVPKKQGT